VEETDIALPMVPVAGPLTADAETFQGIFAGSVNPTAAFMMGKLTVDGDMGLAMQLGAVLS